MKKVSKNPLISVIIPVYNVENYLIKCIESVINQTYKNLEIILIDDGSTDNSSNICDNYSKKDARIKVIHKKNGGLSDARNVGIITASGEYITFVDSDDYVKNKYIEVLYGILVKYNANMSIGSHIIKYEKGKEINKFKLEEYCADSKTILEKMLYDKGIDLTACAKLYKKELFDHINFPLNRLYEDAATTYKLIDNSKIIAVITEPIYYYVIKANSITNSVFNPKKMDLIISTKEMTDYIGKKYKSLIPACNRRIMYAYLSTYNQLNKSKVKNKKIEEQLSTYIKKHKKDALKNSNAPFRDKIGIICVQFGHNFYKFAWKIYSLIGGRRYE